MISFAGKSRYKSFIQFFCQISYLIQYWLLLSLLLPFLEVILQSAMDTLRRREDLEYKTNKVKVILQTVIDTLRSREDLEDKTNKVKVILQTVTDSLRRREDQTNNVKGIKALKTLLLCVKKTINYIDLRNYFRCSMYTFVYYILSNHQ